MFQQAYGVRKYQTARIKSPVKKPPLEFAKIDLQKTFGKIQLKSINGVQKNLQYSKAICIKKFTEISTQVISIIISRPKKLAKEY